VVVTEMVEGTPVERVVEKVVTPTPVPPTEAPPTAVPQSTDTLVFAMQQEPDTLHSQLSTMSATSFVLNLIEPGCMSQNEKLEWVPLGCETVPTLENGGAAIVGEGDDQHLEVTYKIRDGWRWTDGEPVRCTGGSSICRPTSKANNAPSWKRSTRSRRWMKRPRW
jgi:ABC-type transport system substrate-binding protein